MPQTSVILDIAIAAVLALFLLIGIRKGFFRMLADLVLVFVAAFGANLVAKTLSGPVAGLVGPMLEKQIMARLGEQLGDLTVLAEGVVSAASDQLIHTVSFGILFLMTFIVLVIALLIFVSATDLVLRLPVLHQCNQLGGALLGFAMGCLIAWIGVQLCLAFGWWVTAEMVDGSGLLALLEKLPLVLNEIDIQL